MLTVTDLHLTYGAAVQALRGVDLHAGQGEAVAVLGSNGAGKTSLLRAISGNLARHRGSTSGQVTFEGRSLIGLTSSEIVAAGLAHVPEGRRVFAQLAVEDNLHLGLVAGGRRTSATAYDEIYDMFPILGQRRRQPAGQLSGGEQQMLAIGRALMARPRLLMLDEPSLGLAPKVIGQIGETIQHVNRNGTTVILVEQNTTMALSIATSVYVLDQGQVALRADPRNPEVMERVRNLYLGVSVAKYEQQPHDTHTTHGTLSLWQP